MLVAVDCAVSWFDAEVDVDGVGLALTSALVVVEEDLELAEDAAVFFWDGGPTRKYAPTAPPPAASTPRSTQSHTRLLFFDAAATGGL